MKTPFKLLPLNEFSVLKIIRIEGPNWNPFTANLPYLRTFNPSIYNSNVGDILDEAILHNISETYPNSRLRYSSDILFIGELEDFLKGIEGGSRKAITIQFWPMIPYSEVERYVGKDLFAYPFNFELRLSLGSPSASIHLIQDFILCKLPIDQIEVLKETIRPI